MRGSALFAVLAAALLVTIGAFMTSAQVIDSTPCQQACYEQKTACITACGEHTDPVECEGACQDELLDCLQKCG